MGKKKLTNPYNHHQKGKLKISIWVWYFKKKITFISLFYNWKLPLSWIYCHHVAVSRHVGQERKDRDENHLWAAIRREGSELSAVGRRLIILARAGLPL